MIDHIGVAVADATVSAAFYSAALAPLGIVEIVRVPAAESGSGGSLYGFGYPGGAPAFFWIGDGERVGESTHVAFRAEHRSQVVAFHAAALGAGGVDHGGPGLRPHYGPHYFAAFVLDPDRINVEVVCYAPE